MTSALASHFVLPEPSLSFHPDREHDRSIHPLIGLKEFGPHSKGLVPDPVRVATIAPAGESGQLYKFMRKLHDAHRATERKEYLTDWPGFKEVFGVRLRAATSQCRIELTKKMEDEITNKLRSHVVLADSLVRSIQELESKRNEFDVLFIYLPRRWSRAFTGEEGDEFDLHDHIKATTAVRGIPVQLVREDSALSYPDIASVMWRVGLAVYAKAGGIPWKLADTDRETAYIGISYALRPKTVDGSRFVTCCSQVFDAQGTGLEFIAYDADAREVQVRRENPFLSRHEMFRIITRSVDLYRRRHAGSTPRRVFVQKTTEFKPEEVQGAMEALHLSETVELVQVVQDVSWRGVKIDADNSNAKKGKPAKFPVERGTVLDIGPYEALLWVHGATKGIVDRGIYFQGKKGTPQPIRLVRHAGHGSWDATATAVLGLSKMNWNNDALYDMLPVTMSYASVLARVLKRVPSLVSTPYQFRFFM